MFGKTVVTQQIRAAKLTEGMIIGQNTKSYAQILGITHTGDSVTMKLMRLSDRTEYIQAVPTQSKIAVRITPLTGEDMRGIDAERESSDVR